MRERRKIKRRHILFYSRVFNRQTGELIGYLGDLTTEGAMVISEEPLEINVTYRLRLDLPEDLYNKTILGFNAHSVWCKPDVDPNFFNTGFKFIDIATQDQEIIQRIIADYKFREE